MRKVLNPVLLLLVVFLAGCMPPSWSGSYQQAVGYDLQGREVRVAVSNGSPPFNQLDETTGEAVGWDYDVCRAMCDILDCTPVFVPVARSAMLDALANGECDMAADGMMVTAERERVVDFSAPYMVIRQVALVRREETRLVDAHSLIAGDGLLGVQIGSVNERVASLLVDESRIRRFDTFDLPIQALIGGQVDAVVIDEAAAEAVVAEFPDRLRILPEPLTGEDRLAFAFPAGSGLIESVNYALRTLERDGTLDRLYEKWWGEQ